MRYAFQGTGPQGKDSRNISIIGSMVLIFLVAVGIAYVGSATGESSQYQTAAAQAQYLARQGIHERGLAYLRSLTQDELPNSQVNLLPGEVAGVGSYRDVMIVPTSKSAGNNAGLRTPTYTVSATGVVRVRDDTGGWIEVVDSENEEYRPISFARYLYLTSCEKTVFGEYEGFGWFGEDTICGRVHSNDYIRIIDSPIFLGCLTSSAPRFYIGSGHPIFVNCPPQFNVPPVPFPDSVVTLRRCAAAEGRMFDGGGVYQFRLVFYPDQYWAVYRWRIGAPYSDTLIADGIGLIEASFFFFAPLELKGWIRGVATVGSSEDIRLIDDIWYWDSLPGTGEVDTLSQNFLGIIAEGNIIVANTPENGRDNHTMGGQDIIINAAMLALGESFTFEDQNDLWNLYQGPYPDERGEIHFWGSMGQYRRGYVHRSNHGGSGYGKDYHYDTRFDVISPPCWPMITNADHQCLFDIVPPGEK